MHSRYIGKSSPYEALSALNNGGTTPTVDTRVLRVQTLGAFSVWRGHEQIPAECWARRSGTVLFKCLLCAPGHRMHQEQLIDVLWPNASSAVGAGNLRVAVHWLRKLVDGDGKTHIRLIDHWLMLAPSLHGDSPVEWLDADAFVEHANRALAGDDLASCRAALDLYGGEYLPDDRYEEWAMSRREELRQLRLAVLLHAADLCARAGASQEASRHLHALLAADSCHEVAARALMHLHTDSGRRAEAIRVYRRLARDLKAELDLLPEPETQALCRMLYQ
ncbi:MAG: transcriptional activator domain protein [Chloroflexi bacterium]|nr:transcriptional activator domain protein [Chloroflexota bacterium]